MFRTGAFATVSPACWASMGAGWQIMSNANKPVPAARTRRLQLILILISVAAVRSRISFVSVVIAIAFAGVGIEVFNLEVDGVHDRTENPDIRTREQIESTRNCLLARESGTNHQDSAVGR